MGAFTNRGNLEARRSMWKPCPRVLGNSNDASVSESGSSPASPSLVLPVNGEGVSPRVLGNRCFPKAK